jgi:phage baseplate assembly protein V
MSFGDEISQRGQLRRVIASAINDQGAQQYAALQGIAGENPGEVTRLQHFGFNAIPPAGSEGLLLALGGRSDKGYVLGLEHPKYRPTGNNPGETYIYDANSNIVSLVQSNIRIVSPGTITLTAPTIVLNGSCHLGSASANTPVSMQGTVDTGGFIDETNVATKVFVV